MSWYLRVIAERGSIDGADQRPGRVLLSALPTWIRSYLGGAIAVTHSHVFVAKRLDREKLLVGAITRTKVAEPIRTGSAAHDSYRFVRQNRRTGKLRAL